MANIDTYLSQIRTATRGETVRDAITGSIRTMGKDGVNAETLSGRNPSYFATAKEVNETFLTGMFRNKIVFEDSVIKGSTKAVRSGALYELFKDLTDEMSDLLGED